ncbi:MAG: bifunctional riboflavin kinase/FAD synthetase [Syntrophobacteraceae bacterium]
MEVFTGIDAIRRRFRNPALTIGNFDGVHRGHHALFQKVKQWAEELEGESVVITFHPHPIEVLFPGKALPFITSHEQKLELIAQCGIDVTLVIPFSHEFSRMSALEFVKDLLVDKIGVKAIVVGHDYRFGHSREGDMEFLKRMGKEHGFAVDTIAGIRMDDTVVSSTAIRQLILKGNVRDANRLLGRLFEVSGTVIVGRKRGAGLGFPTANLRMPAQASPRTGVYVVEAEVDGKTYGGAANLGYNPTFGDTDFCLEVHLFDFNQDIYGKPISVRFIDRLRDEKRFSGPSELIEQIKKDVLKAKEILGGMRGQAS